MDPQDPRLVGFDLEEDYGKLLSDLLTYGRSIKVRGFDTLEISPYSYTLTDVNRNVIWSPMRNLNHAFRWAELIWVVTGQRSLKMIASYNSQVRQFSDDGRTLSGAYGPRIHHQLLYLLRCLSTPGNRQAVCTTWRENPMPSKDIPCTIMHHYLVRGGRLHLYVYMRSNDTWLGLPYDIFVFTSIQKILAASLGLQPGIYRHLVGSLHLYKQHLNCARQFTPDVFCSKNATFRWPLTACSTQSLYRQLDKLKSYEQDLRRSPSTVPILPDILSPWSEALMTMKKHVLKHLQTHGRQIVP